MNPTSDFILNQTMLRITDPKQSLAFYQDILGMTLLDQFDFPEMSFTLVFYGLSKQFDSNRSGRAGKMDF